jgi:DNA-directed RNA polymerase sigma subunit (sigma70/sigma32)
MKYCNRGKVNALDMIESKLDMDRILLLIPEGRDKDIVIMRINEGQTLRCIATYYGLTPERIRQIVYREFRKAFRRNKKMFVEIFNLDIENTVLKYW